MDDQSDCTDRIPLSPRTWQPAAARTVATVCLLLAAGCGDGRPDTVPATGTVTYHEQPVADAQVVFMAEGARPASAKTDAAGKFVLGTFVPGDGAVVGEHRVTIAKSEKANPNDDSPYPEMKSVIPSRYSNPASSPLTATVKPGDPNDFQFDLTD